MPAGVGGPGPVTAVSIRLLGRFEIGRSDGSTLEPPPGVAGHALEYVALKQKVPVDELAGELWPEAPPGAGRNRLRTVLTRLRQAVGPLVVRSGDWVALAPEVAVDADMFVEACAAAQAAASVEDDRAATLARAALDLYRGELLPAGRHLSFTVGPRERLRRRFVATVHIAVDAAARSGDVEGAVQLLEDTVAVDPHNEALYLRAATLLGDAGRRSEASRFVQRAEAALDELGLRLSAAGAQTRDRLSG